MKSHPKVAIIVLNYNGQAVLKDCLASLFRVNYPNFEVVVVDNGSTDGSLEAARMAFSRATFIKNEENLGFSAGNNVGIRHALEKMSDYVLLLNNDTEVEKDFLEKLVTEGESFLDVGLLSPLIFLGRTGKIWFSGGRIDWLRMKTSHFFDIPTEKTRKTDFMTGCAMLIKKEVFREIGLLDEDFFLYWEDADFGERAARANFNKVVVRDSQIYHFEKSGEAKGNKLYWLVLSGLIFFQKNAPIYLRPWIGFYSFLRRQKNWRDRKKKDNQVAKMVHQAHDDFRKYLKK